MVKLKAAVFNQSDVTEIYLKQDGDQVDIWAKRGDAEEVIAYFSEDGTLNTMACITNDFGFKLNKTNGSIVVE